MGKNSLSRTVTGDCDGVKKRNPAVAIELGIGDLDKFWSQLFSDEFAARFRCGKVLQTHAAQIALLFLAALLLYGTGLDNLPLRDWDEGIVAQVARDMYRADRPAAWLFPTIGGAPYWNKPPLVHWAIALSYHLLGVGETASRLPGALFGTFSVAFLYAVARELFARHAPALLAASVYLTLLPVARHGRLAMLDAAAICFWLAFLWLLLRSRRHPRCALPAGLCLGGIFLTKGFLGVLLGAIALFFLAWDAPRSLLSVWLWGGLGLGIVPAASWYAAQGWHYGLEFFGAHFGVQSWQRVWQPVEQNEGAVWYYALESLKYAWPWTLFWPQSFYRAWQQRDRSWVRFLCVCGGGYFLAISLMATKLPWYLLPVYPALAIATGNELARFWEIWDGEMGNEKAAQTATVSKRADFARASLIFGLRSLAAIAGMAALGSAIAEGTGGATSAALALLGASWAIAAEDCRQRNRQFVPALVVGTYLCLLLFFQSGDWVWELNEAYPVGPVAEMVRSRVPPGTIVYTSFPRSRPSLNFYSDRQIVPAADEFLAARWQTDPHPYFLIRSPAKKELHFSGSITSGVAGEWHLVTKGKRAP